MGFDLYGVRARSETGEYFRNNVWWWRPLANYVVDHVEIPAEDQEHWFYNNGHEIEEDLAMRIADALDALIESGDTERYEREYKERLEALPLETCEFCKGTGQRDDAFVQGACNACGGDGKSKNFATNYPFEVENVKEFAKFCRESGGFTIC